MNRLAAEGDPPDDVYCAAQFPLFWLVYHWCDEYVWNSFCTLMNGMMNDDMRLLIWGQLCESLYDL